MPGPELASTGKDVVIRVLLNGALQDVLSDVVRFTNRTTQDEIVIKHMGTSGSRIHNEFVGEEGDIEFTQNSSTLDELKDYVIASDVNNAPYMINIVETIFYRDGTSKTFVYRDCVFGFDRSMQRGQANTTTISWKSGKVRQSF